MYLFNAKIVINTIYVFIMIGLVLFTGMYYLGFPKDLAPHAQEMLPNLRNPSATFNWTWVPFFVLVIYIYADELYREQYGTVFCGLFFLFNDLFLEVVSGASMTVTGYSPIWTTPAGSSLILLRGLNMEIFCGFALIGLILSKLCPYIPHGKTPPSFTFPFIGVSVNRRKFAAAFVAFVGTSVEWWLVYIGHMYWPYLLWSTTCPFVLAWAYYRLCLNALKLRDHLDLFKSNGALWASWFRLFFSIVLLKVVAPKLTGKEWI